MKVGTRLGSNKIRLYIYVCNLKREKENQANIYIKVKGPKWTNMKESKSNRAK
jgi:hypothetical protein